MLLEHLTNAKPAKFGVNWLKTLTGQVIEILTFLYATPLNIVSMIMKSLPAVGGTNDYMHAKF